MVTGRLTGPIWPNLIGPSHFWYIITSPVHNNDPSVRSELLNLKGHGPPKDDPDSASLTTCRIRTRPAQPRWLFKL